MIKKLLKKQKDLCADQIKDWNYTLAEMVRVAPEPEYIDPLVIIDNEINSLTRTPTHGPCCTCQACGQYHDDCTCGEIEVLKNIREKIKEKI